MIAKIINQLEKIYYEVTYWKTEGNFIWFDVIDHSVDNEFEVKVEIDNEDHDWWVWEDIGGNGNWKRRHVISL